MQDTFLVVESTKLLLPHLKDEYQILDDIYNNVREILGEKLVDRLLELAESRDWMEPKIGQMVVDMEQKRVVAWNGKRWVYTDTLPP